MEVKFSLIIFYRLPLEIHDTVSRIVDTEYISVNLSNINTNNFYILQLFLFHDLKGYLVLPFLSHFGVSRFLVYSVITSVRGNCGEKECILRREF